MKFQYLGIIFFSAFLSGCISSQGRPTLVIAQSAEAQSRVSATLSPTQPLITTAIATLTLVPSVTLFPEPPGCIRPPEDYERILVNGHMLSKRTLFMLKNAYQLYGGKIDITGPAITQGHYTSSEPLSFGTHSGGGVIDLSVLDPAEWTVLYDEIEPLIQALRVSGFAAWLRDFDELSPGSAIHIHAVAVGDKELSASAVDQLIGPFGYFRGYNGLPQESGIPILDRRRGPVICQWMYDSGYRFSREP